MILGLEKKLLNLYKIETFFYQPHIEYSYYLVKKNKKNNKLLEEIIKENINLQYKKIVSNIAEDIYFIDETKQDLDFFESIRIRTYQEGDYHNSANIIFALKNNIGKEEIYVTVHKNIYDLDEFLFKISKQLYDEFRVVKKFFIKKNKSVFFIKNFIFRKNSIVDDYLSFSFEKIIDIYDENHKRINKKLFLSNYILEIEFAGKQNMTYAKKLKHILCNHLKKDFYLIGKKNRKSFEIVKSFMQNTNKLHNKSLDDE